MLVVRNVTDGSVLDATVNRVHDVRRRELFDEYHFKNLTFTLFRALNKRLDIFLGLSLEEVMSQGRIHLSKPIMETENAIDDIQEVEVRINQRSL